MGKKDLQKKSYFHDAGRFATRTNELMKVKTYNEKEGKVDMCKAITELIKRGRTEGRIAGMTAAIKGRTERGFKIL